MKVLVVNAGSSSLKYQLFDTTNNTVIAKGLCERIKISGKITHKMPGREDYSKEIAMPNHSVATKILVDTLTDPKVGCIKSMSEIEAVGHRIVHGGAYFFDSCLITDDVIAKLEKCIDLAPQHTEAHLQGIRGCLDVMPNTPQVVVFDTAFHQTMPREAYTYAIPHELSEQYKIRRYGFHGTSHKFVSGEMRKILGKTEGTKIVTCHLGNGSSISAVKDGKVVDTSMGFTPLAGVEMGSRCGDMDPAIVPFLMQKLNMTPDEMNHFMNEKCGFLGVSGISSDCRDLEAAYQNEGNQQAQLAMEVLGYQIKKYIGSYAAAMGGLDAIVFTAGIGENTPKIRKMACTGLAFLGVELDDEINAKTKGCGITKLSTDASKVQVYMIPTNEELVIASDTEAIVSKM
jgi:acetate kinase